jgi:hypothetical protein
VVAGVRRASRSKKGKEGVADAGSPVPAGGRRNRMGGGAGGGGFIFIMSFWTLPSLPSPEIERARGRAKARVSFFSIPSRRCVHVDPGGCVEIVEQRLT